MSLLFAAVSPGGCRYPPDKFVAGSKVAATDHNCCLFEP